MMNKLIVLTTGCFLASAAMGTGSTNPSHSPVIMNGGFEQWEDGMPAHWSADQNTLCTYEDEFTYNTLRAAKLVIRDQGQKSPVGRIYQDVKLKPNSTYILQFAMAKHGTGSVAVRVQPIAGGNLVSGGRAVLNWSNIWSWRFPWNRQQLEFTTGESNDYRLTFLNYGKPGEPFWLSEVSLQPVEENDEQSIVSFYRESIMRPFLQKGRRGTEQPLEYLFSSGTVGDYSPEFVGVTAHQPLRQVDLRVGKPLTNGSGATLPSHDIVIRSVGEQALLPLTKPRFIPRGENAGWWVTTKVPESAEPGVYQGSLEMISGGQVLAEIPYVFRVETFRLPRPTIPMFVYHAEVYFPSGDYLTEEMRLAYYRDMKEHGMNTVTLYANPDVDGRTVDFQRDYRFSAFDAERLETVRQRNGWREGELEERASYGVARTMELLKESGLTEDTGLIPWLPLKAGAYSFGDMPSTALRQSLEQWDEEWPKPLLYVLDEPYGQPDRIEAARRALDRIRALDLPVQTMTANLPVEELGEQYDIWIQGGRRVNPEMAIDAARLGKELWTYNCNMPTENAPFTRAFFGFWAYRTKVKGIALWAYYDAKTWFMDANGKVHGKNGVARLSRICPSPDGPVPTISWETTREGVTDYRYAMLFQQQREQLAARKQEIEKRMVVEFSASVAEAWKKSYQKRDQREKLLSSWSAGEREAQQPLLEAWDTVQEAVILADAVEDKTILSVPYDALAPMGAIPWSSVNGDFIPVIGGTDATVAAEEKRAILRAYIRTFETILDSPIPASPVVSTVVE